MDHLRPQISLLHATYRRPGGPNEVRDWWLKSADTPSSIEYIVAMDSDDVTAITATSSDLRVISSRSPSATAVRNWNAAASLARGDLLVVISDDLAPPPHWDTALLGHVAPLRPLDHAFTLKLADSPERSTLMRHPVISRAYYLAHGLFDPRYTGVYCDNDITRRAYWKAFILDSTAVVLNHRHPTTSSAESTKSHERINSSEEYRRGASIYLTAWDSRHRFAHVKMIGAANRRIGYRWIQIVRSGFHAFDFLLYSLRFAQVRLLRLLTQSERDGGQATATTPCADSGPRSAGHCPREDDEAS